MGGEFRRTALVCALLACAAACLPAAAGAAPAAARWTTYDRPATYRVVTDTDVPITMSDGIVLRANVARPTKPGRYPVLIIQTPYNKDGLVNTRLGGASNYFVQRGYVVVTVDVRGTGSSEGVWDSFGEPEQSDGPVVVRWAAHQPWSTGKVGLFGPSYMGINQLITAAQHPPNLKAIFPIVPMGDAYRDITFTGGQINVAFIPFWLGLVTAGGLTPPTYALASSPDELAGNLIQSVTTLASHLSSVLSFQSRTIVNASTGGDLAYDGPFWKKRSTIEIVDKVRVPTFVTGGLHDLFQRGEPLLYERLKQHVPTHLLMGPWNHVQGSVGQGLPQDGIPALDSIALRWFDRYLLGLPTHPGQMPKVTQYSWGKGHYVTQPDFPDPRLDPKRIYLRGGKQLDDSPPHSKEASQGFLQQPLSGLCTQSTVQWTAGLGDGIPCTSDNNLNEAFGEAVYTTAPMKEDLELSGPALATIWVTTTARDALLTVRITDVTPDGKSHELTSGWLAGSFRKVDSSRSRYVDGRLLEPWHPFTKASLAPLTPGKPYRLPVEIFPTRATIEKGDRLRVTIGPSDFPHQAPPLPQLLDSLLGQVQVLTDPKHRSYVALPTLGTCQDGCPPLPLANLRRG